MKKAQEKNQNNQHERNAKSMTTHAKSEMSAKKVEHLGSARTTKTRRRPRQAPAIPQQSGQGEETLPDD